MSHRLELALWISPRSRKQYRNQWVLIEYSKLDKHLRPKAGRVIAHAPNKEDIYKALLETHGKNVSLEFYGKVDETQRSNVFSKAREDIKF